MAGTFKTRLNYKPHLFMVFCMAFPTAIYALNFGEEGRFGTPQQIILLILISFIAAMMLYVLARSPKIIISNQAVRVGRKVIYFNEIAEIELYSSINLSLFANTEISALKLKNGKQIKLFLENYSNGHLIRLNLHHLKQHLSGQISTFTVATQTPPETNYNTEEEDFTVYRQSALKVFSYWVFLPFVLIFTLMGIQGTGSWAGQLVVFGFAAGMLYIVILQSRYFLVSDNYLVVKNYLMPWWSKTFHVSEIDKVGIFSASKAPPALNLVTTNFRHYRYPSGFMSFKMYNELMENIKENQQAIAQQHETITQ